MANFSEEQRMLVLAALSYRGFTDVSVPLFKTELIRDAIARGLDELAPVRGEWDIAWGPVCYRAPFFSIFDDNLMYAVRGRANPNRYAIAIRGTNPVSSFDWLFGDLWADRQTPWPYGNRAKFPDAKISFSTALGLSILQHMRSPAPPTGVVGGLWSFLSDEIGGRLRAAGEFLLRPLEPALGIAMRKVREELRGVVDGLAAQQRARARREGAARITAILAERASESRLRTLSLLDKARDTLGDDRAMDVLRLLEGGAKLRASLADGHDIRSFLTAAVAQADGPVDVVVTGHSKGGALSSTVALWLADTQGKSHVAEAERWDPDRKATVRCFSYAGPTAGNAAFAARSDAVIGPRCQRIANTKDIVTRAWALDDLRAITELYGTGVHRIPAIADLVTHLCRDLEEMKYCHVAQLRTLEGEVDRTRPLFFDQLVYQHLEGYLRGLELEGMDTATFFRPLE